MLIDQKKSHDPCYVGNQTWLSEEAPFGDFSSLSEWNKSFSLKTEWTKEKKRGIFHFTFLRSLNSVATITWRRKKKSSRILAVHTAGAKQLG